MKCNESGCFSVTLWRRDKHLFQLIGFAANERRAHRCWAAAMLWYENPHLIWRLYVSLICRFLLDFVCRRCASFNTFGINQRRQQAATCDAFNFCPLHQSRVWAYQAADNWGVDGEEAQSYMPTLVCVCVCVWCGTFHASFTHWLPLKFSHLIGPHAHAFGNSDPPAERWHRPWLWIRPQTWRQIKFFEMNIGLFARVSELQITQIVWQKIYSYHK